MKFIYPLLLSLLCLDGFSQDNVVPQLFSRKYITQAAYSQSRQVIISSEYRVSRVEFTDARTKLRIGSYATESPVISLAVDSSGKYFIAGTERGVIHIIETDSLQTIRTMDAGLRTASGYFVIHNFFPLLCTGPGVVYFTGALQADSSGRSNMTDYFIYRYDIEKDKLVTAGRSGSNRPYCFLWNKKQKTLSLLGEKQLLNWDMVSGKQLAPVQTNSLSLSSFGTEFFFLDDSDNQRFGILSGENRKLVFYDTRNLDKKDSVTGLYRFARLPANRLLVQSMDLGFYIYDLRTRQQKRVTNDSVPFKQWCYALLNFGEGVMGAVTSNGIGTINLNVQVIDMPAYGIDPLPWGLTMTGPSTCVYGTEKGLYEFDYTRGHHLRTIASFSRSVKRTLYIPKSSLLLVETAEQSRNRGESVDSLFGLDYKTGAVRWTYDIGSEGLHHISINPDSSRVLLTVGRNRVVELQAETGAVSNDLFLAKSIYGADFRGYLSGFYTGLTQGAGNYCIEGIGKSISNFAYSCFDYNYPLRVFATDKNKDFAAIAYPEDSRFYVFPLEEKANPKTVNNNARVLAFSPDNQWLAAGSFSGGYVRLYYFPSLEPYLDLQCGVGKVYELVFSNDGKKLFALLEDGYIAVISIPEKRILAQLILRHENYIIKNKEGYYTANKQQLDEIGLRVVNRCFPISNADIKYNRPDIIIREMGEQHEALLHAYEKAHAKRLRRLNTTEARLDSITGFPEATINRSQFIPPKTHEPVLTLSLSFYSPGDPLKSINIRVNDVPVFGSRGFDVSGRNLHRLDTSLAILLSAGPNVLSAECSNTAGIRSTRDRVNTRFTGQQESKLYFAGIGVDRFTDNRYNLQYSAKDIRDLLNRLKEKYGDRIIADTLFNENVSVQSVKAMKKRLLETAISDKVILAFSGHGLLSREFDYYLSTHAVNFDKPEENGLPYDILENLLDSIPARQKLMLIDACHSGEVDKDDLERLNNSPDSLVKGLKPVAYKKEGQLGLVNSFELMQTLFVQVGESTGATVISAAAGTQFALERNDLKNGVFTYAILEAMRTYNGMKVSELKQIVGERVEQLTKGLQKPTSRNENTVADWSLW